MLKNIFLFLVACFLIGCGESQRVLKVAEPEIGATEFHGEKMQVAVGRFQNQSSYHNGVFNNEKDYLGSRAQTLLVSNLVNSGRFLVLDRTNMQAIKNEAQISKNIQSLKGAKYIITGDITEFGRRTTGHHELYGILGNGKKQVAYARVTLNLVDVKTSSILASANGAGEFAFSNGEIVGFGTRAGYDSTLNDKVLGLAIKEAVNNLGKIVERRAW